MNFVGSFHLILRDCSDNFINLNSCRRQFCLSWNVKINRCFSRASCTVKSSVKPSVNEWSVTCEMRAWANLTLLTQQNDDKCRKTRVGGKFFYLWQNAAKHSAGKKPNCENNKPLMIRWKLNCSLQKLIRKFPLEQHWLFRYGIRQLRLKHISIEMYIQQ